MFTPVDVDAMDFLPMDSSSDPAGDLRRRLSHGRGQLLVLLAISLVWLMDISLLRQLEHHHVVANTFNAGLSGVERLSTLVFVIVTLGLSVSLFRGGGSNLFRWALVYLILSMVQVVANVLSMVATASAIQGGGLTGLWYVAAVYMQSV
jgi:predicted PurR-regulated permease PerM